MLYIYSGAAKWRPLIIICTIILAVTEGLKDFIWIYGSKRVIEILEKSDGNINHFQKIMWIVFITATLEGLFIIIMQVSETTASSRITDLRCKFILMTNRKIMKMPFEM